MATAQDTKIKNWRLLGLPRRHPPMAHAAPAGHTTPLATRDVCTTAMAAADSADNDYNAIKKDLERRIADDAYPDKSELQALHDADAKRVITASQAQRACRP
ncbi:hypothetical protein ACFRLW_38260 [Streptomyces sp. NPDC056728]